jgi:hypothetical protein
MSCWKTLKFLVIDHDLVRSIEKLPTSLDHGPIGFVEKLPQFLDKPCMDGCHWSLE